MKAKGRLYLILLLVSITIRLSFYFFSLEGPFPDWIGKTELLYNAIFFGIVISLLNLLKDRKWLIGLVWIIMIDSFAYKLLEQIQDAFSPLPEHQYELYHNIMSIPPLVFYICIFFVRKSPARFFFRCLSLLSTIPILYLLCAAIFHFSDPYVWMTSPGGIVIIDILLNLLLAGAVLRTPALRRAEYADFLK
jgi:hypothetical protein